MKYPIGNLLLLIAIYTKDKGSFTSQDYVTNAELVRKLTSLHQVITWLRKKFRYFFSGLALIGFYFYFDLKK